MSKLNEKTGYLPVVFLALTLACIGVSCEEENATSQEPFSQEFLSRDVEIDWSAVEPVDREFVTWFNSFAFAAVSRLDGELIIHGEFNSDLPVTLFNGSGYPVNNGYTSSQEEYTGDMTSFSYTKLDMEVDFPMDSSQWEHHFKYAIVGEFENYEVVPFWPWHHNNGNDIAEQASSLVYEADEQNTLTLIQRCGNPEIFRFFSGENHGIMICFEQTGSISANLLRTYVVIYSGNYFTVDVECASTPILFQVNGELFVWAEYSGYHCGTNGEYIQHLHEDGKCWSNSDWSN